MRLFYNAVEIGILTLHEFMGEPVYTTDGTTYLYTRYRIHCTGVINGQAELTTTNGPPISYRTSPSPDARTAEAIRNLPIGIAGRVPAAFTAPGSVNAAEFPKGVRQVRSTPAGLPPNPFSDRPPASVYAPSDVELFRIIRTPIKTNITDRAIRHRLQTPRGRLVLFTGDGDEAAGDVLLMSPRRFQDRTDAKTGPNPTLYGITESMGDGKTYIVDFAVETFINEADENGVPTGPLLANRYSSRHDIDTDGFTVITVEGEAIFNSEFLYRDPARSPDDFRLNLFIPVPMGFIRGNIIVEGTPDGTGVNYSFTDRQLPVHLPAAPYVNATQVECVHRQIINTDTDILAGALNIYERGLNLLVNTKFSQEDPDSGSKQKKNKKKKKPPAP